MTTNYELIKNRRLRKWQNIDLFAVATGRKRGINENGRRNKRTVENFTR